MPITSHATVGPMEQVWALGWFINRLLSQRPSNFAVVGVWALAIPSLLVVFAIPFHLLFGGDGSFGFVAWISMLTAGLMEGCYLLLAIRVTLSWMRYRVHPAHEA